MCNYAHSTLCKMQNAMDLWLHDTTISIGPLRACVWYGICALDSLNILNNISMASFHQRRINRFITHNILLNMFPARETYLTVSRFDRNITKSYAGRVFIGNIRSNYGGQLCNS